jgi:hypothetical protein
MMQVEKPVNELITKKILEKKFSKGIGSDKWKNGEGGEAMKKKKVLFKS